MRIAFLNREKEQARLNQVLARRQSSFCCVYGRRRCGKSRLLTEVLASYQQAIYYMADEREAVLQRASLAAMIARQLKGFDQVNYPDWYSLLARWWEQAPTGAVLAIDEFPYLVSTSPELPSLLQRHIDQQRKKPLHLIICGSSQRMMQGLVMDATAPLYGRADQIIVLKPLGAAWVQKALRPKKLFDALEAYSIWGGIPRYWELAVDYPDTWAGVREQILDPMGVLHNEPHRLLLDDMRNSTQAMSILSLIGQGCHRMMEIAARLEKPATSLTRPIQRLMELGLIKRERPYGAELKQSKKTLYRIDDPFLAFWYRYVQPNLSRLQSGVVRPVEEDIKQNITHHVAEVWEELVRQAIPHLNISGHDWQLAQRWWGPGVDRKPLECDVMASSIDGSTLLVGEVKLQLTSKDYSRVIANLKRKIDLLPMAEDFKEVVPVVFGAKTIKNELSQITLKEVFSVLT